MTDYKVYDKDNNLVASTAFSANAVQVALMFKGSVVKYNGGRSLWVIWKQSEWNPDALGNLGYWESCKAVAAVIDERIEEKRKARRLKWIKEVYDDAYKKVVDEGSQDPDNDAWKRAKEWYGYDDSERPHREAESH